MEKTRINKYLAELGVGSRRAVDKMIEERWESRLVLNFKRELLLSDSLFFGMLGMNII